MRDRIEEMGRTTFAGQLDLSGQAAPETTVAPPQQAQREPDDHGSYSADVQLPLL